MEARTTGKVSMECPVCGRVYEVEERKRFTTVMIKGEQAAYEERYYYCENADEDENEFETGSMMNENLMNARNAYRLKHGLPKAPE